MDGSLYADLLKEDLNLALMDNDRAKIGEVSVICRSYYQSAQQ